MVTVKPKVKLPPKGAGLAALSHGSDMGPQEDGVSLWLDHIFSVKVHLPQEAAQKFCTLHSVNTD